MDVRAYNNNGYAIGVYEDEYYFWISDHVTETSYGNYRRVYSTNTYSTKLNGNGGKLNNADTKTFTEKYPYSIDLENYKFTRNGYQLLGWDFNGIFYSLGDTFYPWSNGTLYAKWAPFGSNDVLFNPHGGKINGSDYKIEQTGNSVIIPNRDEASYVITNASGDLVQYLIGWTDRYGYEHDDDMVLWGDRIWYLPGTTEKINEQKVLYASWAGEEELLIYYHGNGGTTSQGSSTVVQNEFLASGDLKLYILDKSTFHRDRYEFGGWKSSDNITYSPGDRITAPADRLTVIDLYAQWIDTRPTYNKTGAIIGNDNVDSYTCIVDTQKNQVHVSLDAKSLKNTTPYERQAMLFYALYENQRMVAVESNTVSIKSNGFTDSVVINYSGRYEPDTCKIFVLNNDNKYVPVGSWLQLRFE